MKKLFLLAVAGVGYVLGAKAGRERYEQIRSAANKVKQNPKVQQTAHQAQDFAKQQAPVVKEKVTEAGHKAAEAAQKVKPGGGPDVDQLHPDSTARQDEPYPKGDLP